MDGYQCAIVLHLLGTLYLCAMVVRDILAPEKDPVRQDGADDPSGASWTVPRTSSCRAGRPTRPGTPHRPWRRAGRVRWGTSRRPRRTL
ncbi:glycosyltransferase 87 family protein [Streptomyces tanashiensis]